MVWASKNVCSRCWQSCAALPTLISVAFASIESDPIDFSEAECRGFGLGAACGRVCFHQGLAPVDAVVVPAVLGEAGGRVEVAAVEDDLGAEQGLHLVEVGGAELLPFGADDEGVGVFEGAVLVGEEDEVRAAAVEAA